MSTEELKKCRIKLSKEIVELSVSNKWVEAKTEWDVIIKTESVGHCICGQKIIHEFTIKNKHNNNRVIVGSTCVDHFENIEMIKQKKKLNKIKCKICNFYLKDKESYNNHRKTKKHIKKQTCCNCSKKFKNCLRFYQQEYYCKKCCDMVIKKCIKCDNPFGKKSELPYWKKKCINCYNKSQ